MFHWLKNLQLYRIVSSMFIGFLVLAFINYLVIKKYADKVDGNATEIEVAGKTRLLTEKVFSKIGDLRTEPRAKEELERATQEKDIVYNTFLTGGYLGNSGTFLNPVEDDEKIVLKQVISLWNSIKHNIDIIITAPAVIDTTTVETVLITSNDTLGTLTPETRLKNIQIPNLAQEVAQLFLTRSKEQLLTHQNNFVQTLIARNKKSLDEFHIVLLGFLLFNSICIVLVLYACKKFIFNPLNEVIKVSNKISDGEVGTTVDYKAKNEIGKLSKGINKISKNLTASKLFIERIAKGELDDSIDSFGKSVTESDSIENALLNMQGQMQTRAKEDEIRQWTTEGMAKFVDILRANDDVNSLGDAILSQLTEYTHSNQAGIYLLNDSDESNKHLELTSLYAFNSKKYDTKSYRLGEGLVGQTFLEKKTIYLLEVPEDYISITSGLGDGNPRALLLVPLKVENDVHGVMEIASFNEFENYQIEFIEKLCESIASTISSVKANQKTKQLLEESQQLTEQMQAQEEEMRQNMEELTATQEEMARKESAVNDQIALINESVGLIEYFLDGEVLSSNDKLQATLGYTAQSLNSLNFQKLHKDGKILSEVKEKGIWSGWLDKIAADGSVIKLKSELRVVKDEGGASEKIIEIISQFVQDEASTFDKNEAYLGELEEELQQNLDALEITQEQISKKLKLNETVLENLLKLGNAITYNEEGEILRFSAQLNIDLNKYNNVTSLIDLTMKELTEEKEEIEFNYTLNNEKVTKATIVMINKTDRGKTLMIFWV